MMNINYFLKALQSLCLLALTILFTYESRATLSCSRLLQEKRYVILNDSHFYGGARVESLVEIDNTLHFRLGFMNSAKESLHEYASLEFARKYPHLAKKFGMEFHILHGFVFLPPKELNVRLENLTAEKISNSLRYDDAFFSEIPKPVYADHLRQSKVPLATHSRMFYHDRIADHQVSNFLMPEVILQAFVTRLNKMYELKEYYHAKEDPVRERKAELAIHAMVDLWDWGTSGFGFRLMSPHFSIHDALVFLKNHFYEFNDPLEELHRELSFQNELKSQSASHLQLNLVLPNRDGVYTPNPREIADAERKLQDLLEFGQSGKMRNP